MPWARQFRCGRTIPADEVRQLAKRAKDAAQARRLLAIAAVLDGASREDAAKIGGMDRQTLRDWVIRFNGQGPDGLINIPSPGVPPKLDDHPQGISRPACRRWPDPGGRWRGALAGVRSDHATSTRVALSVSDDTIYRALKDQGFSPCGRPAEGLRNRDRPDAIAAFKKLRRPRGGIRATLAPGTLTRGVVPGRDARRPEE